ncbi:DUF4214 domain-containing protein [Oxalobacteraceae bacterium A2-2]
MQSDTDKAGNTLATPIALPRNTAADGSIDGWMDADVYKLDLDPWQPYTIILDKPAQALLTVDLYLDGKWSQTPFVYLIGQTSIVLQLSFASRKETTLVVSGIGTDSGNYHLQVAKTIEHDGFTPDIYTTGRVTPGSGISGNLEHAGDVDWVAVYLMPGKRYTLELYSAASSGNSLGQDGAAVPQLALMDANGKVLATATKGGLDGDPRIEFTVPVDSLSFSGFFLAVSEQLGKSTGTYTVAAHEAPLTAAGDVSDAAGTPQVLSAGVAVESRLDRDGDRDFFAAKLTAGKVYEFDIETLSGSAGSLTPLLQSLDFDGYLGSVRTAGSHQYLSYKATSTGYHTLDVQAFFNSTASYRVSYKLAALQDDVADTLAGAALLSLGAAARWGAIEETGDIDMYQLRLEAGVSYDFYIDSIAGGTGLPALGAALQLLAADGSKVGAALVDQSGSVGKMTYIAAATGSYYLQVYSTIGTVSYGIAAEQSGTGVPAPVLDTTALSSGTGSIILSGKAGAGSKVQFYEAGMLLGTTTATAAGLFSYTALLADGMHQVYAIASNTAGKLSISSNTLSLTMDSTPPFRPSLKASTPQGNNVTFSGVAEPGSWLQLWNNSVELAKVQADQWGAWKLELAMENGRYTISATASDSFGHASSPSPALTLQVGPMPVTMRTPTMQVVENKEVYASRQVALSGTADAYAIVDVKEGDTVVATTKAGATGLWSANALLLTDGKHVLSAVTTDGAGGTSVSSIPVSVTTDTTAPASPVIQVQLGADGAALGSRPVLQGDTEAGALVSILRDGEIMGGAKADQNGHWLWQSDDLANGVYSFKAIAIDALGNGSLPGAALKLQVQAGKAQLGGAGADIIAVETGSHTVNGGAGVDTATVTGPSSAYTVGVAAEGVTLSTRDSTVLLVNMERIQFSDSAIAFDVAGAAGQAYRLYQAAFGRPPDKAGLGYWIAQMDRGATLHEVAESFVHSAEFASLYGAHPGNSELVTYLYQNVLHRAPDAAGAAYWTDVLDRGANSADVLSSFSESPENQTQLIGTIKNGISYLAYL